MKTKFGITLLAIGSMLLSACGPTAAESTGSIVDKVPASSTPSLMASATLPATLTALPSATSTPDATQVLLVKHQQDIRTYLVEPIEAAITANGGDWFIMLQEMGGEVLYAHQEVTPIWVDNMVHLPASMLFLKAIEDKGVTEIKIYLSVNRDYEASLRQTLYEMQVYGNESSAASILSMTPKYGLNINETLKNWNADVTSLPNKISSAQNLVTLLGGLTSRDILSDESSIMIEDMLDQGDKASNPLYQLAPEGATIHDKFIAVFTKQAMIGELAVVEIGGSTYLLAIFGFASDKLPASYSSLAQGYEQMVQAFWEYVEVR